MGSLAEVDNRVGLQITHLAGQIFNKTKEMKDQGFPAQNVMLVCRFLCVLGHMLRHCSELLETVASEPENEVSLGRF